MMLDDDSNMDEPDKEAILSCDENTNHGDEKHDKTTEDDDDDDDDAATTKESDEEDTESEDSEEDSDSCKWSGTHYLYLSYYMIRKISHITQNKLKNNNKNYRFLC